MASPRLIARGAEAELYRINFLGADAVLKYRVSKPYRHPVFDKLFRYRRTITEARILARLNMLGLHVPAILYVDPGDYIIIMEYIEGVRLSEALERLGEGTVAGIAELVGEEAGIMHSNTIYHGDFTIANIILSNNTPYIIDFGLAGYSRDVEEYAIDIHLLSRSIEALYPERKELFLESFWKGYRKNASRIYREVQRRVEEIRLRGRYVDRDTRRKIMHERYM